MKDKKKIGILVLACYGIGNSIGSGIFVSMGEGIGYTGASIVPALILSCIVVLFAYWHKILMSGMFALPGGRYGQQVLLQPPALVGFSAVMQIFAGMAVSMYAMSIVEFAAGVFPVLMEYQQLIALGLITLFFLTTLMGGKFMGTFNAVMVVVLIASLLLYLIVGLPQVNWELVSPMRENYMSDGVFGLIMAVALMSFACQGSTMPIDMTEDAVEPKKTMPKAILLSSAVVMVVYVLMAIVTTGILPIEQVAGKNLSVVAEKIFSRPLFVLFIIGGACFAIATSLYSTIAGIQYPLLQTVRDGWLPEVLGKRTKKGYPWVLMGIMYLIAVVPVILKISVSSLVSQIMIPTMIVNTANNLLAFKVIKAYPNAWKGSFFHMPRWLLNATLYFATFCSFLITVALFTTLGLVEAIVILVAVIALFVYSSLRLKSGKVNLSELELAKKEAQAAAEKE